MVALVDSTPYLGVYENVMLRFRVVAQDGGLAIAVTTKDRLSRQRPPPPSPARPARPDRRRWFKGAPGILARIRFADPDPSGRMRCSLAPAFY
ncbi:MAG: hypothetical protein R2909_11910 [Gemmatimonadales bacterium]